MGLDDVATRGYLSAMRTVGIKALKDQLSEHVQRAAAGETIQITDRGRVVAELVPPGRCDIPFLEGEPVLADLVRRGLARGPLAPPGPLPTRLGPLVSHEQLMTDLATDRADR